MADRDTSKAKVINPLLCSTVTGLSLDDFIQNAVLMPAATAVQPNDNAQTRPPRTITSGNTIIRNHPEIEPSTFTFQPNTTPAKPNTAVMTSKLDEIDLSKRDEEDDFDLDKYYSRLHTTPNLNKEEVKEKIEVKTSESEFSEIDLLSSSLVSEDRENSSMASDFAQNLSQLPSVLPHVANTVFNSFSSIWNAHKWETEDDRRYLKTGQDAQRSDAPFEENKIKIGEDLSSGEGNLYQMPPMAPVPLFDTASFKGIGGRKSSIHGHKDEDNRDVVDGKSGAVPKESFEHRSSPGLPPTDIGGANKYRLGSHKKKTYAHVPGLMLGETEYEQPRHHLPTSGIPPIPPINTPAQQIPSFSPINTNSPYNPNQNATTIPSIYQPPGAVFSPLPPTNSNMPDQNINIVPESPVSHTDVKPIPTFPSYGGKPNLASADSVQFFYTPTGASGNISGVKAVNDPIDASIKETSDDFIEALEQKSQNLIKGESETSKSLPTVSAHLNEVNEDLNKVIGEEKEVKQSIDNDQKFQSNSYNDGIPHSNQEQNLPNPMFFDPNANNASMIPSSQLPPTGNLYSSQGKKSNLSVKNFYTLLKKNSMLTGTNQKGNNNPADSFNLPNVVPAPFGTPPVVIFNPGTNLEFASSNSVNQSQQSFVPPSTNSNAFSGNLTQIQQNREVPFGTFGMPPVATFNPAANPEFASAISVNQSQQNFEPSPTNINVFSRNLTESQQNNDNNSGVLDFGQNASIVVNPPFDPNSTSVSSESVSTPLPPFSAALTNTDSTSAEFTALNTSEPKVEEPIAPPMFFNPLSMSSSVLTQDISKPNVSIAQVQSQLTSGNLVSSDSPGSFLSSSILEGPSPGLVPPPAPPKSVPNSGDDSGNKFRLTHKKRLTYYSGPIDYSQMQPPVASKPLHGVNEPKPQQPPIFNPLSQTSNEPQPNFAVFNPVFNEPQNVSALNPGFVNPQPNVALFTPGLNEPQPNVSVFNPGSNEPQPNVPVFNPGSNDTQPNVSVFNPGFNEPQPNVSVFNPGSNGTQPNVSVFNPGFNEPQPNVSVFNPLNQEFLPGAQNFARDYSQTSPYSSAYGDENSSNISLPFSSNHDQNSTQNQQFNNPPFQSAKDNSNSDVGKFTSTTSLLGLASKLQEKVSLNNLQKAVTSFFDANYYEGKKEESNPQYNTAEGIFIQSHETYGANTQPGFNSNLNNVHQPFYASKQFDLNNFIDTTANYSNPPQNVTYSFEGNQNVTPQFYNPNQYLNQSQSHLAVNDADSGHEKNKPNFERVSNVSPQFYDPNTFNAQPINSETNRIDNATEAINFPKEQSMASNLTPHFYNPNQFHDNQLKPIENETETNSSEPKQSISTQYYNPADFFDDQPSETTSDVQKNLECLHQVNAVPDVLLNTPQTDVNKSPNTSSEKQGLTSNKIDQQILPSAVGFFDTFDSGPAQDFQNSDGQSNIFCSIPFQSDFRKRPASPRVASFETDPLILDRHQDISFEGEVVNDPYDETRSIGEVFKNMNLSDNPNFIKEDLQDVMDKTDVPITGTEVELKLQDGNKETEKEVASDLDGNRDSDESADFDGKGYRASGISESNTLNVRDREITNTTPEHSYHNQKTMNTAGFYDYPGSRHSLPDNRVQRFDIPDFGSENRNSGDERDAFPPADRVYTSFDIDRAPARNSGTIEYLNPNAMDGDRIDPSVEEHRLRLESQFGPPRSIDPREIYNAQLMRERRQLELEWSEPQLGERRSSMSIRREVEEVDARNEREDQIDIANEEKRLIEMLSRDTPLQNNTDMETRAREEADQRNEELEQQLLQQLRLEASDSNTMDDDSFADENLEENNNETDIDIVQEIQEDLMMTRMMQQEVMREAEQLDQLIGTFQNIIVNEAKRITPNRDTTSQEFTHPYTIEPNPFDSDEDSPVYENIPVKGGKPTDKDGSLGNYFLDSQFDDFSNFTKDSQSRPDPMAAFVPIRSLSPRNSINASFNNNPFGQTETNEASLYDPISADSNIHSTDSFGVPLAYIQQQLPFNHGSSDFVPSGVYAASITSSKEAQDGSDTSETYDYQRNISVSLQVLSGRRKSCSSDRDEGSFIRVMAEEQMELMPKDAQKNTENENINVSVFMQPPLAIPSFYNSSVGEQLSRADNESIEEEQRVFEEHEDFTNDCGNNQNNAKDEFINDFNQSIESNYYGNVIDYPRDQTPELLEVEDISAVNPNNDDLSNVSLATSVAIEQRLERDFNDLCDREVQSIDFVPNSTGNANNADSFDDDDNLDTVENPEEELTDYEPEAFAKLSNALQHVDLNDGTFGNISESSGMTATTSDDPGSLNKEQQNYEISAKIMDSSEDVLKEQTAGSSTETNAVKIEEIPPKAEDCSTTPEKHKSIATPQKETEQNTVPLFNAFSFGLDNEQSFFNDFGSANKAAKPAQPSAREEILGTSKKDDTRPVGVAQPYLYNSSNQTQGTTSAQSSAPNFVDTTAVISGVSNPTYLIPVAVSSRPNYVDRQGNLYSNIQYQNQDSSEFFMLSQTPIITNPIQAQAIGNPPNQNRVISSQQQMPSRPMMPSQQPIMPNQSQIGSNQPPMMLNQSQMGSNQPPMMLNQSQTGLSQPPMTVNQSQTGLNQSQTSLNQSQMSSIQRQMLPLRTQIPNQQPSAPNQSQIGLNHLQNASNQPNTFPLFRYVPNQQHVTSNQLQTRLNQPSLESTFNQMSSIQQRELLQLHRDRNARIPSEFGALNVINQTVQVDEETIRFDQNILQNFDAIPSRMPQNNNNIPSARNANNCRQYFN